MYCHPDLYLTRCECHKKGLTKPRAGFWNISRTQDGFGDKVITRVEYTKVGGVSLQLNKQYNLGLGEQHPRGPLQSLSLAAAPLFPL